MKKIKLTQRKVALVDNEDFDELNKFKWNAHRSHSGIYYAERTIFINEKPITLFMHREIMHPEKEEVVDHRNVNGLDNQKHNLRVCTYAQNSCNRRPSRTGTSRYLGVCSVQGSSTWRAQIKSNGEVKYLGQYKTELEAAIIYNLAARRQHGEFARPNKF